MYFANNIKFLRESRGYTLKTLANKLGYKSLNTIQKWESGYSIPPQSMLYKIAELFDIPYYDLENVDISDKNYGWSEKILNRDTLIKELNDEMEFMNVEELSFIQFIVKKIIAKKLN